jgi:hypothetical protein
MAEFESPYCPECDEAFDFPEPPPVDRRNFIQVLGGTAAAVALGTGSLGAARAEEKTETAKKKQPAEDLLKELFSTLKDDQKKKIVKDYDHGKSNRSRPLRLGMFNQPVGGVRIDSVYTKAQQELLEKIIQALSSGEEGYRQLSRRGTWDGSRSFGGCGAMFFGNPTGKEKYAFVFSGHHLTLRCDGDFADGVAWAGPIYYGHSPNGWSGGNVFNYQTKSVVAAYKALDEKQRKAALITKGNPGEQIGSVQFKPKAEDRPGLPITELSKDQKELVEKVMRTVLSPYRQEDVEEVMAIIKKSGGMDKIKLAFYSDNYEGAKTSEKQPWSFWRLEGPGFVWNYRVLPHVHTYVNCCLVAKS